jgi:hypothetical protein
VAQLIFCPDCQVEFTVELRGKSCPACGQELVHARVPAGAQTAIRRRHQQNSSKAVWDHILKKDVCAYCSDRRSTTIDHILPKGLGGSKGSWTNRTGSCFDCNQAKAHTPLLHFLLIEVGEDLSHVLDEDGRWPMPSQCERNDPTVEEQTANAFSVDPRTLLFPGTLKDRAQAQAKVDSAAQDYLKIAEAMLDDQR